MRFQAVLYLLSRLLFIIGICALLPIIVALYFNEPELIRRFLITAVVFVTVGVAFFFLGRSAKDDPIGLREGFLLVTLSWLVISFFGAIPFYLSDSFHSFVDAFFESTSGFTTTGASVLSNVESLSHSLLFWRDFIQWIGGMGIIVLAVAILPQLSIGGMQLMKNEMPGPTFEQLKPRIKQTALSLWKIYVLFSILEVGLLYVFGMPLFDSICHMFGTMSTGGFSTQNASMGAYDPATIQMIITLFMFLAGTNFVLHYAFLKGNFKKVFQDTEWRFFVGLLFLAFLIIAVNLSIQSGLPFSEAARLSIFQVLSITTTTGFSTANYDAWPHLSRGLLFLLMFVGGCAGSTGGGLKQVRLLLLFKRAKQAVMQHIFPKAIISVKVNKRVIPESILLGISSFLLIYIVIFSLCTLVLLAFNIDFITATSAVVASLSNIGPGFGLVGATENYAFFPPFIKLFLCAVMIIGRLELFTVLVLFFPAAWRR